MGEGKLVDYSGLRWLTADCVEELEDELRQYGKENVARFIYALEFHLDTYAKTAKSDDIRDKLEELNSLRKKVSYILRDVKILGKNGPVLQFGMKDVSGIRAAKAMDIYFRGAAEVIPKAFSSLNDLDGLLEEAITFLEEIKAARCRWTGGQPKADNDDLALSIAKEYHRYLGVEPTPTKYGPFWSVIQIVWGVLNRPNADPSRTVKAAVEKWRQHE